MKDNADKALLSLLFIFCVLITFGLETFHKDDSVIVNWGMHLADMFAGAIAGLITGKLLAEHKSTTQTGDITETNLTITPPENPPETK